MVSQVIWTSGIEAVVCEFSFRICREGEFVGVPSYVKWCEQFTKGCE